MSADDRPKILLEFGGRSLLQVGQAVRPTERDLPVVKNFTMPVAMVVAFRGCKRKRPGRPGLLGSANGSRYVLRS